MTLATPRDQDRALGVPTPSTPVLLNGWVVVEPVTVWESAGEVRIAGAVKHGPAGTAAFKLDEGHRPDGDQSFSEVVVSATGDVVVHGGPDALPIEATFRPGAHT